MRTASEEVLDMIFLFKWRGQTLCAGAELGVFDYMSQDNARTVEEVAAEMDLDPAVLHRLLRALASLGLLNERPERGFVLTERGALLRTDAAGSLRYLAVLQGGIEHRAIWECVQANIEEDDQLSQPLHRTESETFAGRPDLSTKERQNQVNPSGIELKPPHQAEVRSSNETKNEKLCLKPQTSPHLSLATTQGHSLQEEPLKAEEHRDNR
jgi:Dimerisation domain